MENTEESESITDVLSEAVATSSTTTTATTDNHEQQHTLLSTPSLQSLSAQHLKPDVYCLVGPPGSGKTRFVGALAPSAYRYPGKFWFGYDCQSEDLLFDDFYGDINPDVFLNILEGTEKHIEQQGRWKELKGIKRIFITSNSDYWEWFTHNKKIQKMTRKEKKQFRERLEKAIGYYITTTLPYTMLQQSGDTPQP